MEVYALIALAGVGAWLNLHRKPMQILQSRDIIKSAVQNTAADNNNNNDVTVNVPGDRPSMTDLYNSKHTQYAAGVEAAKAAAAFSMGTQPGKTGYISRAVGRTGLPKKMRSGHTYSALAGVEIPVEEFTHNNMQPFYRGSMTQSVDPFASSMRLENLGGVITGFKSKREVEATNFFAPQKDVGNLYGTQNQTDTMRNFIVAPLSRNNEFPIEREMVGPGIGSGFSSAPEDVYYAQREFAMPKTVDELRAANKPKETFEARTVDGIKTSLGAAQKPCVEKRTPDTFKEVSPCEFLPTTGANLKGQKRPDMIVMRDTNKPALHRQHMGPAYQRQDATIVAQQPKASGAPFRAQLRNFNAGPASATEIGQGFSNDYGKSAIRVYTTTRETTEANAYTGTLTAAIKAMMAPLQDIIKTTKKETVTEGARRADGVIQPQIPAKMTVYDPDQVARTTIKQTTLQEMRSGNVRQTAYNVTVYDPDDVARTTMRQTTQQPTPNANLAPHRYANIVYDSKDIVARTTTKQTTVDAADAANIAPHRYTNIVYDPNEIAAKTTTKQTTLQESQATNLSAHRYANTVYDPEAIARTTTKEANLAQTPGANLSTHEYRPVATPDDAAKRTGRETLDPTETNVNLNPAGAKAAIAFNPDEKAKTTGKETLTDVGREFGNVDGTSRQRGGYDISAAEAKMTQKQVLVDVEHFGHPAVEGADGYRVANTEAKATQKQVLSDTDYYGAAASLEAKKPTQYGLYDNAQTNELREIVMEGRDPTNQGAKVASGADALNVTNTRQLLQQTEGFVSMDRLPASISGSTMPTCLTRERNAYKDLDRLDQELLAQLSQAETNVIALSIKDAVENYSTRDTSSTDMEDIIGRYDM